MLRIAKLTDYAAGLMAHLASAPERQVSAQQLAIETGLPTPTVATLLKRLTRAGLVRSSRGAAGGYGLARSPGEISVGAVISAIEGPVALTECALGAGQCQMEARCVTRDHWQVINRALRATLESMSLADMARPVDGIQIQEVAPPPT
jgi:FeS assembly SUF system regulator